MSVRRDPNKLASSERPPRAPRPSRAVRFGVALMSVGLATLVRLWLTRFVGPNAVPFITYFPAIVLSAWIGGFWPGVLSLVLGAMAAAWLFLPSADLWALETFLFVGLCIAAIGEAQRK